MSNDDGTGAAPMFNLAWGSATHTGNVRPLNEDALLADAPVFVVADGMGGHDAGEVASEMAVARFRGFVGMSAVAIHQVTPAITAANEAIVAAGEAGEGRAGMGTTIVGLIGVEQHGAPYWFAFNMGDSRIYRFCRGLLTQVSVDHSHVQELVTLGQLSPAAARLHPERNIITRALGQQESGDPDYWLLPPEPGERFLLCSDGLSGELEPEEIARVLAAAPEPAVAAKNLLEAALFAGGRDNITVVVVDVLGIDTRAVDDQSAWEQTTPRGDVFCE